ncbi:MAG TPA: hypothetical protein VMT28_14445 [Terriglobales bacterium]|nr:hypothetical protein [Terriglobales bacterium]
MSQVKSQGACSPNIVQNTGQVRFTCSGLVDAKTVSKINDILNELLKRRGDEQKVVSKLDEVLQFVRHQEGRIEEVEHRTGIIQSLELDITIDATTAPAKVDADSQVDAGLQSVVALFSDDETRYRFVTDFLLSHQQLTPTLYRLSFSYKPETPSQILGQRISLLSRMKIFVCNYSEIFQTIHFDATSVSTKMNISVRLNGVEALRITDQIAAPGTLAHGQAQMDVGNDFSKIEQLYGDKISAAHQ